MTATNRKATPATSTLDHTIAGTMGLDLSPLVI
jgi:hypothetical protein